MEKQKELIKKYIKKDITLNVIALELGVPLELVEQCKQELLLEGSREKTAPHVVKPVDSNSSLKMIALRKKYKDLYEAEKSEEAKKQNSKPKQLSQEQLKQIEAIIDSIEQKINKISSTTSKSEARKMAISIIKDVRQIQGYGQLPFELALKFKEAIYKLNLRGILIKEYDLENAITNAKKMAGSRIIQAIARSVEEAQTVNELNTLAINITPEMEKQNKLECSTVKTRIQKRLSDLRSKETMNKIKRIPPNIDNIIKSLVLGEIDIENASKIVEEEARTRVASRPQNKFSVTEEQEKKQIGMQIRTAIMENPDKYQLINPEVTIMHIQQLFGDNQAETVRAIVTNLIGRKNYDVAKRICRKYSLDNKEATLAFYIRRLVEDIKNAEIGDMILKGINMTEGTPDQLGIYYELIEMKLKTENINLAKISLGKSKDGKRNITLGDIWLPESQNKKGMKR